MIFILFFFSEDPNSPLSQQLPNVTPIQGPIFLGKNGTVPVVPLVQNPALPNSTFVQIPVSYHIKKITKNFFPDL